MKVRDVLPRDTIPGIDDPEFAVDYFGDPDDEVIVVDGDPARAYPVRILSYHEVVNDSADGRPIAVTWCPICGSAVVYDRTVGGPPADGRSGERRTLTFGTSGKLGDDGLVMYDRETDSEWHQPTGECIAGPFTGTRLDALPARIVTYERFREDHPEGLVLRPVRGDPSGGTRPAEVYDMAPYERYAAGEAFGLYGMRGEGERRTWDREDLDAKTVVLGVTVGESADAADDEAVDAADDDSDAVAVGYPRPRVVEAGGVVTDTVGGREVVVFAVDGTMTAFEDPGFDFEAVEGSQSGADGRFRADGATWDPITGESDDGRRLDPVAARRLYAFAWQDAHGPDSFYEQ